MEKFTGSKFKLKIKVEAPVGGRKGSTLKLLHHYLKDTNCFTVEEINFENSSLNIIYHEPSIEESINLCK